MPTTPSFTSSTPPRTTKSATSTFCTTGRYGARTSKMSSICSAVFILPSFALDWDRSGLVRSPAREVLRYPNTLRYAPANSLSPATPAHTPITLRSTLAKTPNHTASQFFACPLRYLRFFLLSPLSLSSSPWLWTCGLDSTTFLNARKIGGRSVGLAYISFVSRSPSSRPNALERLAGLEQYSGRVYQH